MSETYHAEIWGGQEKTDPPMTQSRPPAFIWYRFHGCGLRSLGVYKRTKSKKERDGRTDGQTDKSKTISLRFAGDNKHNCKRCEKYHNSDDEALQHVRHRQYNRQCIILKDLSHQRLTLNLPMNFVAAAPPLRPEPSRSVLLATE